MVVSGLDNGGCGVHTLNCNHATMPTGGNDNVVREIGRNAKSASDEDFDFDIIPMGSSQYPFTIEIPPDIA